MESVPLWQTILFPLCLIALTALFTLMESAAEAMTEARLERMQDEGIDKAEVILKRLPHCAGMLEAIQCAQHFTLLLLGSASVMLLSRPLAVKIGELAFLAAAPAGLVKALCLIIVLLIVCAAVQFFGIELARRIANINTDALVLSLFTPMRFVRLIFRPLSAAVNGMANFMIRMSGVDPEQAADHVTEDEILAMVDIGEEKGSIESSEKELIENIFEFNNLSAEDCMIHRTDMTAIDVNITEEEFVDLVRESGFSRFPVYEDDIDTVIGILTTRSYFLNLRLPPEERKTMRELILPAFFIPESMKTDVLFREMQTRKSHMAIVVDEYGGTSGLVTLEDLLEEIVGNIYDEFDPQAAQDIIALPDGSWKAAGSVELERLCETIGIDEIESDEFDTLGGLVFSCLTAIPDDGSHPEVDCFGLHIRVDELTDRRIEWAIVTKAPEEEEQADE